MKTIELTEQESRRWDGDAVFQRDVRAREQARARRIGQAVELYHIDGRLLMTAAPEEA